MPSDPCIRHLMHRSVRAAPYIVQVKFGTKILKNDIVAYAMDMHICISICRSALHMAICDTTVSIKQSYGKDSPFAYLLALPHTFTFTFTGPIGSSSTYFRTCTLRLLLSVLTSVLTLLVHVVFQVLQTPPLTLPHPAQSSSIISRSGHRSSTWYFSQPGTLQVPGYRTVDCLKLQSTRL